MADTGWVTVGTGANNADAGNTAWSNTGNITTATDSAYAQATSIPKSTGTSQYLHGTNLGLSIPAGSTIDGIEALVRHYNSGSFQYDHTVQLIIGGSRSGSNKASGTVWASNTIENFTYGGASDLWGLTPTRGDVVASNFGLSFRMSNQIALGTSTPRVYYIQMKVHYTEAAGNTGAFFALFNVKDRIREILKPKKRFWLPEPVFARAA